MKRYTSLFIALLFALHISVANAKPNQLTPTITWELLKDGTLMISGTGDMPDFELSTKDHWRNKKFKKKIVRIIIGEGITSVGDYNFSFFSKLDYKNLVSISLPSTLRSIGREAFFGWPLSNITFPENLEIIGEGAFEFSQLKSIKLPENISIGKGAFYYCSSLSQVEFPTHLKDGIIRSETFSKTPLKNILLPKNVTIETNAFKGCALLRSVDFQNGSPKIQKGAFINTDLNELLNIDNVSEEYLTQEYFSGSAINRIIRDRQEKAKQLELAAAKKRAEEEAARNPKPKATTTAATTAGNTSEAKPLNKIVWPENRNVVRVNRYDSDFRFTDGMLPIGNSDLHGWGFVDESGRLSVPYEWQFSDYGTPHFDSGHCLVAKYEKSPAGLEYKRWYIIDKQGRANKLPANIKKVSNFHNGIASVVSQNGNVATQFFINTKGMRVFPNLSRTIMWAYVTPDPVEARPFKNGLAAYYDIDSKRYGFINTKGQFVVKPVFLDAHDFSEGLAAVKLPATQSNPAAWGFIDTSGKMVIPAKFSIEPGNFRTGRAPVEKRNGHKVMINKSGEVVSPEFYELSECFSNGNAIAGNMGYNYFLIDSNYKQISDGMPDISLKEQPYIEKNGLFQTFNKGLYGSVTRLTSTAKFLIGYTIDHTTGPLSDKLIHIRRNGIDAFMNYEGVVVFSIEANEF